MKQKTTILALIDDLQRFADSDDPAAFRSAYMVQQALRWVVEIRRQNALDEFVANLELLKAGK